MGIFFSFKKKEFHNFIGWEGGYTELHMWGLEYVWFRFS